MKCFLLNRQAIKKAYANVTTQVDTFIRFVMFCFLIIFYLFFFLAHCLRPHPFHLLDFNLSRGMNKYLVNKEHYLLSIFAFRSLPPR
jgi:hypothetical protein